MGSNLDLPMAFDLCSRGGPFAPGALELPSCSQASPAPQETGHGPPDLNPKPIIIRSIMELRKRAQEPPGKGRDLQIPRFAVKSSGLGRETGRRKSSPMKAVAKLP